VDALATACSACGGLIADDGYCGTCGAPAVRERDHWSEQPVPWVAAVCDRGLKHWRNEDAVAVSGVPAQGEFAALVVCDGVSSSQDSDLASLAAARDARDVLIRRSAQSPSIAGRIRSWTDQLTLAAKAASDAVLAVTQAQSGPGARPAPAGHPEPASPPSCTFVAAVVDGPVIVAGWIGDSRAYWLPDGGPAEQLSVDDSWATEQIQAGVPRDQAETSPQAHAITRWVGIDAPGLEPRCAATIPGGPGWLLVCSDGLWNYCSAAADLGRLVAAIAGGVDGDPLRTAGELVAWANQQGGHDNVTVALARLEPADETRVSPQAPAASAAAGQDKSPDDTTAIRRSM
jgi:serine/threonine protein phosphatase PrpC